MGSSVEKVLTSKLTEYKEEMEEIRKRRANIIVHGLKEPAASSDDLVKREEEDQIGKMLHTLKADGMSVSNFVRLGKKPLDPAANPRPMKIVMASEDQREQLLRQSKNLRDATDKVFFTSRLDTEATRGTQTIGEGVEAEKGQRREGPHHNQQQDCHKTESVESDHRWDQAKVGLKCFYTNLDSLNNKKVELEARIVMINPDIIGLLEINPKNAKWKLTQEDQQIKGLRNV